MQSQQQQIEYRQKQYAVTDTAVGTYEKNIWDHSSTLNVNNNNTATKTAKTLTERSNVRTAKR